MFKEYYKISGLEFVSPNGKELIYRISSNKVNKKILLKALFGKHFDVTIYVKRER